MAQITIGTGEDPNGSRVRNRRKSGPIELEKTSSILRNSGPYGRDPAAGDEDDNIAGFGSLRVDKIDGEMNGTGIINNTSHLIDRTDYSDRANLNI